MLLSLISVLVLLVIAFYAVWVAAMGRVQGNEGPELSLGSRVMVGGVAVLALGLAYAVYSHPSSKPLVTAATAISRPSTPPDSRGSPPLPAADPIIAGPTLDEPLADEAMAPAVEDEKGQAPEAAPEVETAETTQSSEPAENADLSAAALALEDAALRPRRTLPAPKAAAMPATAAEVSADTTTAAPAHSSTGRRGKGRKPLTLHVSNALGSDQDSERLTLRIEGKTVAEMQVDSRRPAVDVAVPLPRPGKLHYRLEGVSEANGRNRVVGEGCIWVQDGSRYTVRRKDGSRKVYLQASRASR